MLSLIDMELEWKKNESRAFEFYLKSAEGGNFDAQNNLGVCYQSEIEIEKIRRKHLDCI